MDKTTERYLAGVRQSLTAAGEPATRIASIEQGLREQIEDAVASGEDVGAVVARLDPPDSFVETDIASRGRQQDYFGLAGFIAGLVCFVGGFLLIPNVAPGLLDSLAKPLIVVGAILSISLGIVGRRSKSGVAAMLLGGAVILLIAVTGILGAG